MNPSRAPTLARILSFAAVLILGPVAVQGSTNCVDYPSFLHVISTGDPDLAGFAGFKGVAILGDLAYLPTDGVPFVDLVVYDVSNPSEPEHIHTLSINDPQGRPATNIVIHESIAFITMGYGASTAGKVLLISLTNGSNPKIITSVEIPTTPFDVAATDEYAYVACDGGRFAIVDINPPASASLVSTVNTGGGAVKGITLLDDVLHVAAGSKGLRSYSLSNPTAPAFLDSWLLPTEDTAVDVSHDGNAAKLAVTVFTDDGTVFAPWGRIDVFDATTPANLLLLGSVDLLGPADHGLVQGDIAFAAVNDVGTSNSDGIETISLSDPQNPVSIGAAFSGNNGTGLATFASGTALFLPQESNFKVFDITNPASPVPEETGLLADSFVYGSGDRVFLGDEQQVQIRDAAPPDLPLIGVYDPIYSPIGIDVQGSLAAVWMFDEFLGRLDLVDLGIPSAPDQLSSLQMTGGRIVDVDVEGTIAGVVQNRDAPFPERRMRILDLADPANPQPVFELEIAYRGVELHGGAAYFVHNNGIDIYDVGDPAGTTLVHQINQLGLSNVKVVDGLLYVLRGDVDIYDLSNPFLPSLLGTVSLPSGVGNLGIHEDIAYCAGGGGMHVVNVANPSAAQYLGTLANGRAFRGVAIAAEKVFLKMDDELVLAPPQCSSATDSPVTITAGDRLTAVPNPFRAETSLRFALGQSSTVGVNVYDVSGRLVRRLFRGSKATGVHSMDWNGRDDSGAAVSAGVYLVRLDGEGVEHTKSVVRLR